MNVFCFKSKILCPENHSDQTGGTDLLERGGRPLGEHRFRLSGFSLRNSSREVQLIFLRSPWWRRPESRRRLSCWKQLHRWEQEKKSQSTCWTVSIRSFQEKHLKRLKTSIQLRFVSKKNGKRSHLWNINSTGSAGQHMVQDPAGHSGRLEAPDDKGIGSARTSGKGGRRWRRMKLLGGGVEREKYLYSSRFCASQAIIPAFVICDSVPPPLISTEVMRGERRSTLLLRKGSRNQATPSVALF